MKLVDFFGLFWFVVFPSSVALIDYYYVLRDNLQSALLSSMSVVWGRGESCGAFTQNTL